MTGKQPIQFHISDHFMLRYIERMLGVDFEAFRKTLHGKLLPYAKSGAVTAEVEGMVVKFRHNEGSADAVTMWPVGSKPPKQAPPRGDHKHPEARHIEIRKRMRK